LIYFFSKKIKKWKKIKIKIVNENQGKEILPDKYVMFLKIQRRPKKKQETVVKEPIEETVSLGESAE
jgi:hypothetical protein